MSAGREWRVRHLLITEGADTTWFRDGDDDWTFAMTFGPLSDDHIQRAIGNPFEGDDDAAR